MSWEKSSYTKAGAALLSESLSGGALTITRAISGTGTIDTDLSEETAVSGDTYELKLLGIDTVEYKGEKARKVSIWTGGADEPYIMHQIGVFGRLNDDPEDTLLFLMQDERGVEIPAIGTADHEFQIAVLLAVSTKANISLTVDPQVQALMKLVDKKIEKHNDAPDAHAKIITAATSKALKELEASGEIMSEEQVLKLIRENGGGGGSGGGKKYDITLAADGWTACTEEDALAAGLAYQHDAAVTGCTEELDPHATIERASRAAAQAAGLDGICQTMDGVCRFYAARQPTADITLRLVLLGAGQADTYTSTVGNAVVGDAIVGM